MRKIHRVEALAPLPKRRRAAAYARVSSGKETMLHSLSAQVSFFSGLIQKQPDWEYVGVYADESLTGTKDNRPEFRRLLDDCRAGKIDIVITKSISRFARNTVTMLETVRELKSLGVDVYFQRENIYSMSSDGELMLTILASFAQEESRSVSENCRWRIQRDFKKGKTVGFNGMYGYDYKNVEITVNEEQAAVVRRMFEWYISGLGLSKIAQKLNEQGVPSCLGGRWTAGRVGDLIGNEKLTGNAILQKFYTESHLTKKQKRNNGEKDRYFAEGTHPAIVSTEIFETAKRLRAERAAHFNARDNSKNTYPFSGEILCERCGKKYKRKKAVGKFNWQCSTFLQEGKAACPAKQIPEDTLMAVTAEVLVLAEFDEDVFKKSITEIRVPDNNCLAFFFSDGRIVHRKWQDRSRRESWTDEMKQVARERALQSKGGASK